MSIEKHLEMIQDVTSRLAGNSYSYKGWSITIAAGLVAFLSGKHDGLLLAAIYPLVAFWFLDAHSLALERAFRKLYDKVRMGTVDAFSMSLSDIRRPLKDQIDAMLSTTILIFYGSSVVFIYIFARVMK